MPGKALRIGVVMDPIGSINPKKDSTLAMLLAATRRGWSLHYMEQHDLNARDGKPYARTRPLRVRDDLHDWFELDEESPYMLLVAPVVESRRTALTKEQES